MGNLMLSDMGALFELERSLIRERQKEGSAVAKQRDYKGRKETVPLPCLYAEAEAWAA